MPVAIVTGASRGLGRALADELVQRSWSVVIDARNDDELQAARAEFVGSGAGEVIAVGGDVTDPAHRKALIEAAERLGGLDLLVNNASTLGATPLPHLVAYDTAELGAVFETNVVAPLALIQDALEGARRPMIVNVTSDASVEHYESWGGYGASKAALDHVSLTLAAEQPGLRIYSVDPGAMRTRMIESDRPSGRYKACDLLTAGAAR